MIRLHEAATGREFPQAVHEQLFLAIGAVFRSWNSERAVLYRRQERIRVLGIEPAPAMSSEEGAKWIATEHDKWAKVIREKGIRAE